MSNAETFWDSCAERNAQKPIKRMDVYERTMTCIRAYLNPTDHAVEAENHFPSPPARFIVGRKV